MYGGNTPIVPEETINEWKNLGLITEPKMTVNSKKILTLSTAHLHPLEVNHLNDTSICFSDWCNLISVDNDVIEECKTLHLVCFVELLKVLKEQYQVDYVLFDPDEPAIEELQKYDW